MLFFIAAAAAIFVLAACAVLLYGATSILAGGFIRLALGALLVGMSLSVVFSATANLLLVTFSRYDLEPRPPIIFLRSFLAAMGQPTLTGIIGLSLVALISLAASKVRVMVEEMDILIRSHAAYAARSDRTAAP
ncbi:conserved hypothetical protein [Leishmania major strain Friedlin]|uniref:Uncharacterized protein n=1 Tax=Leishmania major TaxID=5664 RepID=Q4Q123_LEIMA|nr:conserved hypothetical protein [Leishmania major strain Friedlin]CAG9583936.1 hypothetical_protein_-_conserved [Leishmania major strain Friedlin]CAJ09358.1 conserved hypothetical protein [Leishmania major strain Friedlin]|eukprot:XP_001686975.1 conserved hypothetical protein [Leishmania major strain Friedlin]